MTTAVVPVPVAAAAALLAVAVGVALPRVGTAGPVGGEVTTRTLPDREARWGRATSPLVLVGVVVGSALLIGVPPLLLPTGALLSWAAAVMLARARRDARAVARRAAVVDACEALLGELLAGQPPQQALRHAAEAWPELAPAARAGELGADVPAELRAVAARPGAGALERLAGAWQLCAATGAGLAAALEQVLATLRADHEVVLAVRSELAAARATARLLAVLPLLVLLMAQGVGGDPWHFLLATVAGQLCLAVGAGLAVGGVVWLERIADEAQGEQR